MPRQNRGNALMRVTHLIESAADLRKSHKPLAVKRVKLARKLAMRVNLRLPSELKRRFCEFCHSPLVPGDNLRVRLREGHLVYFCTHCKHFFRMPLHNK